MTRDVRLPPRLLPILYVALAHVALALAFAVAAVDARAVSGFFYHARMLAVVHLVTLGWITASILGSLYWWSHRIARAAASRLDGLCGVRAGRGRHRRHGDALLDSGIWRDGLVGHRCGRGCAGGRPASRTAVRHGASPVAVRAHIGLAFVNIAGAATMGVLLGFNKVQPFLPGYVLTNVYAHAHLAAIGWASMMVIGVAYGSCRC